MVHAGCVFVASILPVWDMNVRIFWVNMMECLCALTGPWFILSCERDLGNGVRSHANSKGKIPSTRGPEEGGTHDAASRRTASPAHDWLSYSGLKWETQLGCLVHCMPFTWYTGATGIFFFFTVISKNVNYKSSWYSVLGYMLTLIVICCFCCF